MLPCLVKGGANRHADAKFGAGGDGGMLDPRCRGGRTARCRPLFVDNPMDPRAPATHGPDDLIVIRFMAGGVGGGRFCISPGNAGRESGME